MVTFTDIDQLTEIELRAIVAYLGTPSDIRINVLCELTNRRLRGLVPFRGN